MNSCTILCNQKHYYYFFVSYFRKTFDLFCIKVFLFRPFMSTFDGLSSYFFRREMENTQPMREEMDGTVFRSPPKSASFVFVFNMIKVLFRLCTSTWRVNNYVSRQRGDINRRNESTVKLLKLSHCTAQL